MFSKLETFRSHGTSSQIGNQNHHKRNSSEIYRQTLKSLFKDRKPDETSICDSPRTATHVSDENLSQESAAEYSSYDGRESIATSSSVSEEIDVGPSVLLPYEDAEEQFLEDYEGYFMHLEVNNVRKEQYPKLELQRIVYLDFATLPLYSIYQVEHHMKYLLEGTVFLQSSTYNSYIDSTCRHILNLLNTTQDDYSIIFTPGISSCYRLFGELFHFKKGSVLVASEEQHKSLQHVVQSGSTCKIKVASMPMRNKDLCINSTEMYKFLRKRGWSGHGCGVLAYAAQSLLSGMCHSLNWIPAAQQNGWEVLLDVSSCLPMVSIDLSLHQPEFIVGSLHHMLGYPSSVGFLLVRRDIHWIHDAEGSTDMKLARFHDNGKFVHVAQEGEVLNMHIFAALNFGLEHLESIGITAIHKRVQSLMAWLIKALKSLKHKLDWKPLLQLYGSTDLKYRGSILAFNVLDPTGNIFPARLVQQLAERSNIILGVSNLGDANLEDNVSPHASTSYLEAVRVSFGPISVFEDVYRLAQFLSRFRDEDYMSSEAAEYVNNFEMNSDPIQRII